MLTIVIGTGYLGRRVLDAGLPGEIVGLSRSSVEAGSPVHVVDLDADGPLPLALPDRYRVLYTVPPAADATGDERLEGLLARLEPPPASFVNVSTTGVYGNRDGATVNERSAAQPGNPRSQRRLAAEQALDAWAAAHGVRLCVLRVPGIYGPWRLGIERIRQGLPSLREADASPGNRIHVDDLVSCCRAALLNDTAAGIFNVGDGDSRSATWFAGEVARQCGLAPPPQISRADAEREFSAQRMSFLGESRRVDTARMRSVLGVTPRYANPEDGIRASIAAERAQG